ncbi:hypothetical protein Ccrd_008773 [Cynara cardunculus var. scolymus]|uniref:Uncharacterized protein n=1 Tax=Cynara cardunculus var. scolymus TaxID=59895 RepID=A0A103XEJ6_CYNCS|nr:hypothetical protein Ccrd_008773 [Cynara cardunculus var. scolymus]
MRWMLQTRLIVVSFAVYSWN